MDSIKQVNLRFLAQGMVKLKPQDLPPDYAAMTKTQLLDWADGYLNDLGRNGLLQAVAYLDIEDDTRCGAVEVYDGEDYDFLAETESWHVYNNLMEAQKIHQEDTPHFRALTKEEIMELPDDQEQAYLGSFNRCPFCLGRNIEATGQPETDSCYAWLEIYCGDCESSWSDRYRLEGISYEDWGTAEEKDAWANKALELRQQNLKETQGDA